MLKSDLRHRLQMEGQEFTAAKHTTLLTKAESFMECILLLVDPLFSMPATTTATSSLASNGGTDLLTLWIARLGQAYQIGSTASSQPMVATGGAPPRAPETPHPLVAIPSSIPTPRSVSPASECDFVEMSALPSVISQSAVLPPVVTSGERGMDHGSATTPTSRTTTAAAAAAAGYPTAPTSSSNMTFAGLPSMTTGNHGGVNGRSAAPTTPTVLAPVAAPSIVALSADVVFFVRLAVHLAMASRGTAAGSEALTVGVPKSVLPASRTTSRARAPGTAASRNSQCHTPRSAANLTCTSSDEVSSSPRSMTTKGGGLTAVSSAGGGQILPLPSFTEDGIVLMGGGDGGAGGPADPTYDDGMIIAAVSGSEHGHSAFQPAVPLAMASAVP